MRGGVRRLVALIGGAAAVFALHGCAQQSTPSQHRAATPAPHTVPAPLPAVTLPALRPEASPRSVDLSSLKGPAVLNFWATWCGVCRREMPVLEEFNQRHGEQVPVIGIDFLDPQRDRAIAKADQAGVTYQLLADVEGELSARPPFPNLRGLPYLALVDVRGHVVHGEFGAVDDVAELEQLVSEHLGVTW